MGLTRALLMQGCRFQWQFCDLEWLSELHWQSIARGLCDS